VGYPRTASIDFVGLEVSPAADQVRIRLLIPNRDGSLRPGLFARVRIFFGPPRETLLLPGADIEVEGRHMWVYVLNAKNEVERREIRIGQFYPAGQAVKEGLKADEWVIPVDLAKPFFGKGPIPAASIDRSEAPPAAAERPRAE
jgi:multidrug efflux pump subunit AcrA (membrane-fusion protein)